ncbi:MAG: hypothetical protein EI684_00175 [Candidatus Viridilinea halotolerans]|uniref:Uncharacterized protein n=1 Tax=Candidatus Viridilinea halotolerans TaxID=2491704 RepID=A0A426UCJ0_9CHLR|nr:MAG: hypothetical protein EI684_00175 [Candidatus Viridilinea halotolerans]
MGGLRRNAQFVGREADFLALAALLKGGQSVAVNQGQAAVASGLGGIGKTQLAIEFAVSVQGGTIRYDHDDNMLLRFTAKGAKSAKSAKKGEGFPPYARSSRPSLPSRSSR